MKFKGWEKIFIKTDFGEKVEAIAPVILSASRATDIPAFHSDWFINRLNKGYIKWINPFNKRPQYVSFKNTRVIVFWSKNPKNMIKYLNIIDAKNINYYFTYTINDYESEKLEPNIPPLKERINTFIKLSNLIGKEQVIWRFDPLILTDTITLDKLLEKIKNIGNALYKYTNKLVISFADINIYKKVQHNLQRANVKYKGFDKNDMIYIAENLQELNKNWHLSITTCAEDINLNKYSIEKNKCIDDNLMVKCFSSDKTLMKFLGKENTEINLFTNNDYNKKIDLKDPGQRDFCGCIVSKDIGQYNTCMHLCAYCYANTSQNLVRRNFEKLSKTGESIYI
ncbi:DUF1848 domain-containing protein [Pectinatus frisingensis]|uniref:DUF1848 domain-containing protein n=1 Tax=Pectinatus frisingensis TaxID=865 RepID=UPI0018C61229|nr:DUF1848 domain-containing protein [Pectinatus frisingensis]